MESVNSTTNSKFGSNFQRKTNITASGFCQTMFLLSLVSFGILHRILYSEKKNHPILTTVINLWVVGLRDLALRFVCHKAISLASVINDSKRYLSLNCH